MYTELRGAVSGRQRSRAEASERYERTGGNVRVAGEQWMEQVAAAGGDSLRKIRVFLRVED